MTNSLGLRFIGGVLLTTLALAFSPGYAAAQGPAGSNTGDRSPARDSPAGAPAASSPSPSQTRPTTRLPKNREGISPASKEKSPPKATPIKKLATIPDGFETDVLYLGADRRPAVQITRPIQQPFAEEVWRQAVLIAAVHELGLVTRDSTLHGDADKNDRKRFGELRLRPFGPKGVKFIFLDEGSKLEADRDGLVLAQSANTGAQGFLRAHAVEPMPRVRQLEAMSRGPSSTCSKRSVTGASRSNGIPKRRCLKGSRSSSPKWISSPSSTPYGSSKRPPGSKASLPRCWEPRPAAMRISACSPSTFGARCPTQ